MDPDVKSRLGVNLITGSVPYDEVVALSERLINKNLESLFNLYPEMQHIQYDDDDLGTVDLRLKAPRIIMAVSGDMAFSKTVLYQLRIASGTIRRGSRSRIDLSNWDLAFRCDLSTDDPTSASTADGKSTATVAGRIYKFPGDYSIQRLFAQLSTAQWSSPSTDYTRCWDPITNKPITFEAWQNQGTNVKDWTFFKLILEDWAKAEEMAGRSTLNVTFSLPKDRHDPQDPTYHPTFLHQQTYPYESPTKGVQGPEINLDGNGFNSLLWCEMVANNPAPTTRQLPWSGNFVIPAVNNDPNSAIDGTFALSFKLILEQHLLPRLQAFNQACEVVNLSQEYSFSDNTYQTKWNYSIGNYNLPSNNDHFKLVRVEQTADDTTPAVRYEFVASSNGDNNYSWPGGHFAKLLHQSDTKVTFAWTMGSDTFTLSGTTNYLFDQTHAKNSNMASGEITGRLRYVYHATWDISIKAAGIIDGVIQFEVHTEGKNGNGVGNLKVWQDQTIQQSMITPEGQEDHIRHWFTENIGRCVNNLPTDLQAQLRTTATFIYPGNGDLDFKNPVISKYGNVLAEITFKTLDEDKIKESGYIEVFPPLAPPPPIVPDVKPKTNEVGAGVAKPVPKLTWTIDPTKAVAFTSNATFVVKGTNGTSGPLGFHYIRLMFSSASEGPNAFREDKINSMTNRLYVAAKAGGATIVMTSSSKSTAVLPVHIGKPTETTEGAFYWTAAIKPLEGSEGFVVNAGDSIEYTLKLGTGAANTYSMLLSESWRRLDDLSKPLPTGPVGSDDLQIDVVLRPN